MLRLRGEDLFVLLGAALSTTILLWGGRAEEPGYFFRPSGWLDIRLATHGLRRGLRSFAALRLGARAGF